MTRCVAFRLRDVARNMRHARVATHRHVLQPTGTCCNTRRNMQQSAPHAGIPGRTTCRHPAGYKRPSPRPRDAWRASACCMLHGAPYSLPCVVRCVPPVWDEYAATTRLQGAPRPQPIDARSGRARYCIAPPAACLVGWRAAWSSLHAAHCTHAGLCMAARSIAQRHQALERLAC